jgi:glutaredoxin
MPDPIRVDVYSRPGCHLCVEAKHILESFRRRYGFELGEINVETDEALEKMYGLEIPVVTINGVKVFTYRIDASEFEKRIKRLWNK